MITGFVCLCTSIIAMAIPSVCVCSFIFGWGDFVQAMLALATIIDGALIGFAMNCAMDYDL